MYSIPLIIGAKKGFPNFNEFVMQTVVQVTRKLELRRPNTFSRPTETNQMYVVGISNVFGVKAWNSYSDPFPRELELRVTNEAFITLTNEYGFLRASRVTMGQVMPVTIPANSWAGLVNPQTPVQSFRIPLLTNVVFLTNSAYRQRPPSSFAPLTTPFERGFGFPIPQWGITVNNRLRFTLVDTATQRVVDYVSLAGLNANLDVTREIFGNLVDNPLNSTSVQSKQWLTNRPNNAASILVATVGILNQLAVSLGNLPVSVSDWNNFSLQNLNGPDKNKAIDLFRAFMGLSSIYYPGTANSNLIQQAPFTPTRKIFQQISWQANDPLVHYTLSDLTDLARTNVVNFVVPPNQPVPPLLNLSRINDHYQPWGGNRNHVADQNAFNLAIKDPLVRRSNDWDFPENQPLTVSSLGHVHRGTPWQTLYLKSSGVDLNAWQTWTGLANSQAARLTQPTNDWRLVDLLVSMLNTNHPYNLLSINATDREKWLRVLDGTVVLTNSRTDAEFNYPQTPPQFESLLMQSNSPQAGVIADSIISNHFSRPDQGFREVGDILATPELTTASPWLNQSSSVQLRRGITDEAYEIIPTQLLPLLRADSVGAIIWTNNQVHIQFTGFDGAAYRIESSRDLKHWKRRATLYPTNGILSYVDTKRHGSRPQFYRSVLLHPKHREKSLS